MIARRRLRALILPVVAIALTSCVPRENADVAVLDEEVCRLTEINAAGRTQLSLQRAEANRLDASIHQLTAITSTLESEVHQLRLKIRSLRQDLASFEKTGVESSSFVRGARLTMLGIGHKVYHDVLIGDVGEKDVVFYHADGVARLSKALLEGKEEHSIRNSRQNVGSSAPQVLALVAHPSQATPQLPQASKPRIDGKKPTSVPLLKPAPMPKTVEVLVWWGRGNPHKMMLRDAFGNKFMPLSDTPKRDLIHPGPWARSYIEGSTRRNRAGGSGDARQGISGYKPIGWNYTGSSLDRIYGTRR